MRLLARTLVLFAIPAALSPLPLPCRAEGHGGSGKGGGGLAQAGPRAVLPFSHDDYVAARARAQRESKLLVVEAWATWCHTCQSMRSFVFTDPLLKPVSDKFIYVALDTDRPVNTPFVERFPITSWPTMLALDPGQSGTALTDERVLARWTGAMTAAELLGRLDRLTAKTEGAEQVLVQADGAAAEGKWDAAASLYADAVRQSVADRPRALLGQVQALREKKDYAGCVELLDRSLPATGNGAAATDFGAYAMSCLDHYADADRRQRLRQKLRGHLLTLVQDLSAPLSVDDRSDGYGSLTELSDALGDRAAGDRYADARLRLLEAAAAAARTPAEAATFDAHRLDSYRRLKRFDAAEKMLLASARAMPQDFNPPSRLARLYWDMGRLDDAIVQVNNALARSYGPRRAALLELQANIRHGMGQTREAVQSLLAAIQVVESMPVRNEHKLALLRKQIAAMQTILSGAAPPKGSSEPQGQPGGTSMGPSGTEQPVARPVAARRMTQGRDGRGAPALHVAAKK